MVPSYSLYFPVTLNSPVTFCPPYSEKHLPKPWDPFLSWLSNITAACWVAAGCAAKHPIMPRESPREIYVTTNVGWPTPTPHFLHPYNPSILEAEAAGA